MASVQCDNVTPYKTIAGLWHRWAMASVQCDNVTPYKTIAGLWHRCNTMSGILLMYDKFIVEDHGEAMASIDLK
ncbi:hypothetical protein F383_34326 [Gossypium arboreum]|uniref:Uncharacterized protein n=1 Tax=Gossypium arboreum TaxID=29729 RepID=A0A0B0PRH0_GOSAR|nr:hypothetical protein F383_34326 [Gossypium arboreum]